MDLKLAGQTALVTGSTAGIGLAIATALAREGASVLVAGRSRQKVDSAVAVVAAAGKVRGVVADAATAEGAEVLFGEQPETDILVNNLGIYETKDFTAITDDDWRRYFDTNVLGGVRLARRYFPGMLARNRGRIIFVSSESAFSIPSDMIHYATTKTAQLTIARGLAELSVGTGVTVNSVLPGPTRSEGIGDILRSTFPDSKLSESELEKEYFRVYRPASLLRRMIEPEEVASLVAYLASPLSSATNGAALRVEGGLLRQVS